MFFCFCKFFHAYNKKIIVSNTLYIQLLLELWKCIISKKS